MLQVRIRLSEDGVIRSLDAAGHLPGGTRGENLACAAATTLIRSAARFIVGCEGVQSQGRAEARGSLSFRISDIQDSYVEYIRGAGDLVIQGLQDLDAEAPGAISLKISGVQQRKE